MTETTFGGSKVIAALESAWGYLRTITPDLPDVVIITGSGMTAGGCWGYFWDDRWAELEEQGRKPEVFMAGERLYLGAQLTFQTLAHEATHARAKVQGIKDTSNGHRYHNDRFRDLAGAYGLVFPESSKRDRVIGYSAVELTEEAADLHADVVTMLGEALSVYLEIPELIRGVVTGTAGTATTTTTTLPKRRTRPNTSAGKNLPVATCRCEPARKIRISKTALGLGPIRCGVCAWDFETGDAD